MPSVYTLVVVIIIIYKIGESKLKQTKTTVGKVSKGHGYPYKFTLDTEVTFEPNL